MSMLGPDVELALLDEPDVLLAADEFVGRHDIAAREHGRRALPTAVEYAVSVIADAAPDADEADDALHQLLVDCIAEHRVSRAAPGRRRRRAADRAG